MRSCVPAAKDALQAALAGVPGLELALVRLHLPTTVPSENLRIYISGTEGLTRTQVTQEGAMREQFELVLLCESRGYGPDPTDAADGLWTLLDALDTLLLEDPEIDGTVEDSWLSQIPAENTLPLADNKGWISRAEVRVTAQAVV
jgi:hypothetical protein